MPCSARKWVGMSQPEVEATSVKEIDIPRASVGQLVTGESGAATTIEW